MSSLYAILAHNVSVLSVRCMFATIAFFTNLYKAIFHVASIVLRFLEQFHLVSLFTVILFGRNSLFWNTLRRFCTSSTNKIPIIPVAIVFAGVAVLAFVDLTTFCVA